MIIKNRLMSVFSILFVLFGCSPSNAILTVKRQADRPKSIHKLLVLALTPVDENRETGEKELVYWLRESGFDAFASFDLLTVRGRIPVKEEITKAMNEHGFDGVLTMGLVELGEKSQFVSTGANTNIYFYNYLNMWRRFYTPGYIDKDRLLVVESNLYVFPEAEMAYSAVSESFISDSFESFTADFSKQLVKSLKRSKILAPKE